MAILAGAHTRSLLQGMVRCLHKSSAGWDARNWFNCPAPSVKVDAVLARSDGVLPSFRADGLS